MVFVRFWLLLETRRLCLPFNNSVDQLLNCGACFSQIIVIAVAAASRNLVARWPRACRRYAILITPHKATAAVWGRGRCAGVRELRGRDHSHVRIFCMFAHSKNKV